MARESAAAVTATSDMAMTATPTTRKNPVPFLPKSLLGFQFIASRTGSVGPSDVIFANQRRSPWSLPAGGPGFGDMREGQKEKDDEGRETHGLHLVALHSDYDSLEVAG
jgi:hypothetical protein